jgi:hypothetical protein
MDSQTQSPAQSSLRSEQQLPERQPTRLAGVLKECPSLEFIIDGTERPINRPQHKLTQLGGIKRCNIVSHPFRTPGLMIMWMR